jgi:hypothetical protein
MTVLRTLKSLAEQERAEVDIVSDLMANARSVFEQ